MGMKLFLKRDTGATGAFIVYDELGEVYCTISRESGNHMKYVMFDNGSMPVSTIRINTMLLTYFTIRCRRRFYVLVPCVGESFSFAIYGSTYRFCGSIAAGCFSMLEPDGKTVMTQKKSWCKAGDGYELNITDEEHETFLLSAAVCADLFSSAGMTEEKAAALME